ncbi:MAG: hypothetical protein Q8M20_14020 [Rhodocyclaceae bacterium]|nr:hypothetical protein [Rhodocyclaceae bacterium]MDZ4216117.1 hypothetical protein [Rhodocyclaceae bacterium]
MKTLNELCKSVLVKEASKGPLHEACALPRSPTDMHPLPEPRTEASFDSSWEVMSAAKEVTKPRRQ